MSDVIPIHPATKPGKTPPSLPQGNDAAVADKLRDLVQGATDGLLRIVALGLFIERIKKELKHGQLEPWIDAHCPGIGRTQIWRWRAVAKNLMDLAGIKSSKLEHLPRPLEEILELPLGDLDAQESEFLTALRRVADGQSQDSLSQPKNSRKAIKAPALSPREQVEADAKEAAALWNGLCGRMEIALGHADGLPQALTHEPALRERIERLQSDLRIALGRSKTLR